MRKNTASAPVSKTDLTALALLATSKYQAGNYKEAIEHYKTLLKTTEKPEWRQTLAHCYLQRALSFAAKGMIKEAIVLWESYTQHTTAREYFDHYIVWLLQTNDTTRLRKNLPQLTASQLDEQYPQLASILGLLLITQKFDLYNLLPPESLFVKHLTTVKAVLSAYQNNHTDLIEAHLQHLPFRSAFKDFRWLMKAILLLPQSKASAHTQLAKISTQSPYYSMANGLLALIHEGAALVNTLNNLNIKQIQLIVLMKQFTTQQRELIDTVFKQKQHLSDKLAFNLAIQYRALFGEQLAKRYCYLTLADYSAGLRDFTKHFGVIDEFEECRLKALNYTRKNAPFDALYYWKRGVTILKQQKPQDDLKIACLMRYIARKEYFLTERISWLENSLNHDPHDRETYLKILSEYENKPQHITDYQHWLHNSVKQFPLDTDFLLLAIKTAEQQQAHNNILSYAHTVLTIDPVNVVAKQAIFNSYLAQIKTAIKSKQSLKRDTALQNLQNLSLNKHEQQIVNLMQGFCVFMEDKEQGARLIADAAHTLYEGLVTAYFCVMMEASAMELQLAATVKKLTPLAKEHVLSAQDMRQLTALILQYHHKKNSDAAIAKALDKIKYPIKYSLTHQHYDEVVLLAFCQSLSHIKHFELMRACVKSALPLWTKPIWMYYRVYAEHNGDPTKCSKINAERLENYLEQAEIAKDERTALLIEKFLDDAYDSKDIHHKNTTASLPNIVTRPIDLFKELPDDLFEQIDKKFAHNIKKTGMERLLIHMVKHYFSDNPEAAMAILLSNLEAFQAMSFLKAAEDLNIPLTVTADDIMNCVKNQTSSVPAFLK